MLVCSYNPASRSALKEMKPSFRQRFVSLDLDYLPEEDEASVVAAETGVSAPGRAAAGSRGHRAAGGGARGHPRAALHPHPGDGGPPDRRRSRAEGGHPRRDPRAALLRERGGHRAAGADRGALARVSVEVDEGAGDGRAGKRRRVHGGRTARRRPRRRRVRPRHRRGRARSPRSSTSAYVSSGATSPIPRRSARRWKAWTRWSIWRPSSLAERAPDLARRVNVDATRSLIAQMEASATASRLVFASSMAIFGDLQDREPPLRVETPVSPATEYGRHKVACEQAIRAVEPALDHPAAGGGCHPPA